MNIKKIVTAIALLIFVACGKAEESKESVKYKVAFAGVRVAEGFINVDGKIEANDTKKVFVDKKLKVKEVFIQEGDFVEKGQILMTFDESERNNITRELEKEELSLRKLKRDYEVEKELNKLGGASRNSLKDMEEDIRTKEIEIESLEEDLEKTAEKVESPVSGTITSLTAQENYSVNTDEPLLEIADLSDMKIVLEVPEYDVKNIKLGQSLVIKPEVFEKKRSFDGEISKISTISQVSSNTSENVLEVEVVPKEKIPFIVPGFKVSATINLSSGKERKDGIVIPKTALLFDKKDYYIFVVDSENKINKKIIKFKDMSGTNIEIVEGLNKGEKYVITPNEQLKDGEKIEVEATQEPVQRKGKRSQGAGA